MRRDEASGNAALDTSVAALPADRSQSEDYLPHLWALCALVSVLCLVATWKLAWTTGTDLDGAMAPPAVGALVFAAFAVLSSPRREAD